MSKSSQVNAVLGLVRTNASLATQNQELRARVAAKAEARRRGADDAVFVDHDGVVLEGTVTNVWWRRGDTLFTPSLELGILAGVTRAVVRESAAAGGFSVQEGIYPLAEVLSAEEAFTTSSVREVMPLSELDGASFAPGPAAAALQAALRELAAQEG